MFDPFQPGTFKICMSQHQQYIRISRRYLKACGLLTESSKPSREGDVVKPEEGACLMGRQGQVGEVVVGGGQGGVGSHLVVRKYQLSNQFRFGINRAKTYLSIIWQG